MDSDTFPDRSEIQARQLSQLRALIRAIAPRNAFYAGRLERAGLTADVGSLEAFSTSMPFTTKDDIMEDHAAHPPYGSNLTYPLDRYTRFSHTSGTTGKLLRWLDTPENWDWMLYNWELVMTAAGVKRGDRVYFPFSFGPFIGFWTAFGAAARMGCLCIPGGGLSSLARIEGILDNEATVLCCSPTYAIRLAEVAGVENVDLSASAVRCIIVAGEPGGSLPATRNLIEQQWPGARVFDHHGMTEVGPASFECPERPGVLHVIETSHYAEVVEPETGRPVASGETGELVLTTLGRLGSPVLRYRSGDLVKGVWGEPCLCGRWEMALEGGILSRVDDMLMIRGVNVYPSAIEGFVRAHDDVAEYRVEIRSTRGMDEVSLLIEPVPGANSDALAREIEKSLRTALSLRVPVTTVESGALPRFELKARRWVRV